MQMPPCSQLGRLRATSGSARPGMCVFLGERIVFVPGAAMSNLQQTFLFTICILAIGHLSQRQSITQNNQDESSGTPVDRQTKCSY